MPPSNNTDLPAGFEPRQRLGDVYMHGKLETSERTADRRTKNRPRRAGKLQGRIEVTPRNGVTCGGYPVGEGQCV